MLEKVTLKDKDKLYKLLEYSLYDSSFYIDNDINENCDFPYRWFENYFTENSRDAYFIKEDNKYIGFVMVNENYKFNTTGKTIAEFFILPRYRRNHYGKRIAFEVFDMYQGLWEVEPMDNNEIASKFWHSIINEYTNSNYKLKDTVYIFESKNIEKQKEE